MGQGFYLDITPKGRNETGPHHNLMDWVRHHDKYGFTGFVDATSLYRTGKVAYETRASADTVERRRNGISRRRCEAIRSITPAVLT